MAWWVDPPEWFLWLLVAINFVALAISISSMRTYRRQRREQARLRIHVTIGNLRMVDIGVEHLALAAKLNGGSLDLLSDMPVCIWPDFEQQSRLSLRAEVTA